MRDIEQQLLVADWCVEQASRENRSGRLDECLQWLRLGVDVYICQNRVLRHPEMERLLLDVGSQIPREPEQRASTGTSGSVRWLHVLTDAFSYGGHTAMAVRWAHLWCEGAIHSYAILNSRSQVPERVTEAADASGGAVHVAPENATPVQVAAWLRRIVSGHADIVVLHIGTNDVVTCAALGYDGGPPVMLVNHAAHIFWLGATVSDLVLNCRGSSLEDMWTRDLRNISNFATLPIPLEVLKRPDVDVQVNRRAVRCEQGIPEDDILIVTVGDSHKYAPSKGLDFLSDCERLLGQLSRAYLLAVGVVNDARWEAASERTQGRLRAVGRQDNVQQFLDAADVYIEGYPFGSTTAALEASLTGLPVVLSPEDCPPPFGTDGVAFAPAMPRPANVDEYLSRIVALCSDAEERAVLGSALRKTAEANHTLDGWRQYVSSAIHCLPKSHRIQTPAMGRSPPESIQQHWLAFVYGSEMYPIETFDRLYRAALYYGLVPRLSMRALKVLATARSKRMRARLSLFLRLVCSTCIGLLFPAWVALQVLRTIDQAQWVNKLSLGRRSNAHSSVKSTGSSP